MARNINLLNKITEALVESWGNGNLNILDEVYSPDYTAHSSQGDSTYNLDAEKSFISDTIHAFSESAMKVTDIFQDGDMVILRWVWTGKHTGESQFMPGAPTGKDCELKGCTFYRIENDKIVEGWSYTHEVAFLKQLGLMPENPYAETVQDTDRTPRGENL